MLSLYSSVDEARKRRLAGPTFTLYGTSSDPLRAREAASPASEYLSASWALSDAPRQKTFHAHSVTRTKLAAMRIPVFFCAAILWCICISDKCAIRFPLSLENRWNSCVTALGATISVTLV